MNLIANESGKFLDPRLTADGQARAEVALRELSTLWLNTGTLCNVTCRNCYIESSPKNDSLVYLTRADVAAYLLEISDLSLPVRQIGITGGEPMMNPDICSILDDCLSAGYDVLLLTNAMRPMMKCADQLLELVRRFPDKLTVRVSIDHPERHLHEDERGQRSWEPMVNGLRWLSANAMRVTVAGRSRWGESEAQLRTGFAALFADLEVTVDANNPGELVIFPEMDGSHDVPEITTKCWGILGVDPDEMMCATSRMVVRRKGAQTTDVVSCTLLPHEKAFSYGSKLSDSLGPVALNHPHCARFCVLGGASCSG